MGGAPLAGRDAGAHAGCRRRRRRRRRPLPGARRAGVRRSQAAQRPGHDQRGLPRVAHLQPHPGRQRLGRHDRADRRRPRHAAGRGGAAPRARPRAGRPAPVSRRAHAGRSGAAQPAATPGPAAQARAARDPPVRTRRDRRRDVGQDRAAVAAAGCEAVRERRSPVPAPGAVHREGRHARPHPVHRGDQGSERREPALPHALGGRVPQHAAARRAGRQRLGLRGHLRRPAARVAGRHAAVGAAVAGADRAGGGRCSSGRSRRSRWCWPACCWRWCG